MTADEIALALSYARTALTDPLEIQDEIEAWALTDPPGWLSADLDAAAYAVDKIDLAMNALGEETTPEHDGALAVRFLLDGLGVESLAVLHEIVTLGRPMHNLVLGWRRATELAAKAFTDAALVDPWAHDRDRGTGQ